MKTYNVIWFDDEYDTLEILRENATINGIFHKGFIDAESGLLELEKNIMVYDAVIVDGRFINKHGGTIEEGDKAIVTVARTLDRLADRKKIPWFILSGHPNFTKEKNKFAEYFKDGKVYDKNNKEDIELLWVNLKNEADNQIETQIRHNHIEVFATCSEKYIGEAAAEALLSILKKENVINSFADNDIYFNSLRKIMEDFFRACNKWGLLPDAFITGTVAMNEASRYFSGDSQRGYKIVKSEFPGKVLSNNIRNVVTISQPASHRAEIDEFIKYTGTPYLLTSTTYQLMDILVWFKRFVSENPDVEQNKKFYKIVEEVKPEDYITGIIMQDEQRNYYCSDCLLNYKIVQTSFKIDDRIKIVQWTDNNNERTKSKYPKFATKFEKLN